MSLRAVSASQIETFTSCQRKWGWRALDKIEAPTHASAAKGTLIHSQFEKYLKGESLDYSTPALREAAERAMPGIVNLPAPLTEGMEVEKAFSFQTERGIVFRGFMDVVVPHAHLVPGLTGDNPCVIDHKSTSSFRYAKTPETLSTDTQAMLYAYEAMRTYRSPVVDLLWNYVQTKGAAATQRVHLRVVSEHVAAQFLGPISASAMQIATVYAQHPKVLDLPPSRDACDAYGGCPYKYLCTDLTTAGPFKEETNMTSSVDLFSRISAANAKEDAAEVPGITNAPVGWVAPSFLLPSNQQVSTPVAQVVANLAANPELYGPTSLFPPPMPVTVAINPPEWQPPPTVAERAAAAVQVLEETKPKRTRRTKAEMAADAAKEALIAAGGQHIVDQVDTYVADAPTTPPPAAPATIPAPAPAGFTLFVDCTPLAGNFVDASDVFSQAKALVNDELKVKDYRFVDYGKGQGAFLIAVNHVMDGVTSDIVIDSRTPEALLCLSDLIARSGRVVRGFR